MGSLCWLVTMTCFGSPAPVHGVSARWLSGLSIAATVVGTGLVVDEAGRAVVVEMAVVELAVVEPVVGIESAVVGDALSVTARPDGRRRIAVAPTTPVMSTSRATPARTSRPRLFGGVGGVESGDGVGARKGGGEGGAGGWRSPEIGLLGRTTGPTS